MTSKLPNFHDASVLVAGDVMLDRYWYGPTNCISPEAPVPVVNIDAIDERPGGAANVAMNIASLGVKTHLVGLTGIDDAAQVLCNKLKTLNVYCNFVSVPSYPTIIKLRVLSHNQQLIRLDFEERFPEVNGRLLLTHIQKALPKIDILLLSDYAKGALSQVQHMIKMARTIKVPVLIDPKGSDFERYRGATLLTPNLSEFEAIVGHCKNESDLEKRGRQLMNDFELSALLITRSNQGMTLLQPGIAPLYLPTQTQEVFDVTGAGDTVIGVLAAALAAGNSLEESCFLANSAASVVVGKIGTVSVSLIELENAVRGNQTRRGFGVMTPVQLKTAVSQARQRGEKIVMTNGIFDILHAGHVSYLTNARNLGDRLIVAVNNDTSTKNLKGKMRPINALENRMIVLSALESVDWVVPFEEDTPQNLINDILPDILVKGGDYKREDIAGGCEVHANGGNVKVLNFEHGFSTSKIIRTIKERQSRNDSQ